MIGIELICFKYAFNKRDLTNIFEKIKNKKKICSILLFDVNELLRITIRTQINALIEHFIMLTFAHFTQFTEFTCNNK